MSKKPLPTIISASELSQITAWGLIIGATEPFRLHFARSHLYSHAIAFVLGVSLFLWLLLEGRVWVNMQQKYSTFLSYLQHLLQVLQMPTASINQINMKEQLQRRLTKLHLIVILGSCERIFYGTVCVAIGLVAIYGLLLSSSLLPKHYFLIGWVLPGFLCIEPLMVLLCSLGISYYLQRQEKTWFRQIKEELQQPFEEMPSEQRVAVACQGIWLVGITSLRLPLRFYKAYPNRQKVAWVSELRKCLESLTIEERERIIKDCPPLAYCRLTSSSPIWTETIFKDHFART